jgi:predicted nucleic acid-binding protein
MDDLISNGFGIADSAHVAFSEHYNAVFVSCDDKLLKKCSKYINSIECLNPITFCELEKLK